MKQLIVLIVLSVISLSSLIKAESYLAPGIRPIFIVEGEAASPSTGSRKPGSSFSAQVDDDEESPFYERPAEAAAPAPAAAARFDLSDEEGGVDEVEEYVPDKLSVRSGLPAGSEEIEDDEEYELQQYAKQLAAMIKANKLKEQLKKRKKGDVVANVTAAESKVKPATSQSKFKPISQRPQPPKKSAPIPLTKKKPQKAAAAEDYSSGSGSTEEEEDDERDDEIDFDDEPNFPRALSIIEETPGHMPVARPIGPLHHRGRHGHHHHHHPPSHHGWGHHHQPQNHGWGHGIDYEKTKLKYDIYKLKAKKKIAILQNKIELKKILSLLLHHKIKALEWLA